MPDKRLKDYCEFIVDCEHKTAPLSPDGEFYSIRTPNVGRGRVIFDNANRVDEETYKKWTRRAIPEGGDLIIAREAPVGNVALVKSGPRVCLGQRTVLLRPNKKQALSEYLVYYLLGDYVQAHFQSVSTGATVPHLNMSDIRGLPVPKLPSLEVQRSIASILSAYDDLIENNTRRIAILEEMARRIYQEWFVNFRFPGHEKVRMVDSELGKIPKGWEVKKLGELCSESTETLKPEFIDPQFPYVGLEHIPRRSITLNQWTSAAKAGSTKKVFRKNDILFGKIRPYFHKVAVAPVSGVCSTDAIVIRPIDGFSYPLVLCCVSSDEFVAHSVQTSNGTKMPRANWKVLVEYPVPIPPAQLHCEFSELVMNIVDMTQNLTAKNTNLRTQRDLLLPKLISGELDVSNMDIPNLKDQAA